MATQRWWIHPALWGFYIVIVLEFLFMISPFALHFYSGYGPVLNAMLASPLTAWLTRFFLPHFSLTDSPILNELKSLGFLLVGAGALLFLLSAIQLYGAKLLRCGAVTRGLYRFVRHPQYLALTLLGLGVTLIWPRFLVLVTFVTMVFLYYALARHEERACVERFGEGYREYQQRTGMVMPRLLWQRTIGGGQRTIGWKRGALFYAATLATTVAGAFALQSHSLSRVSGLFLEDMAILSPALMTQGELIQAYRIASSDPRVEAFHAQESRLLLYVIPVNWYLPDLPLHTLEEIRRVGGGHRNPLAESGIYRVLFARPRLPAYRTTGHEIVTKAYGLEPLGIVRVDLPTESLIGWDEAPDHVIWGDIPTPLF